VTDRFAIDVLAAHDRTEFSCGIAALDRYFREQVTQDIRRHITNCFVAVSADSNLIAGYYTLAASSIQFLDLPPDETKRLPRYPVLPAVLIGRLAVDTRFRGRGLGSALIADAALRAIRSEPAVFTLLVDAKDENAVAFYLHHGFRPLESKPGSLFLSVASVAKIRPQTERR
jgi:ribosomal protein S18 acetylase RimI-like enzyme